MRAISKVVLLAFLVTVALAQSPEPPLTDSRFTVHTLVREDIFAGFLEDDMTRFNRGEKNIEILLEKRPAEKASLLAWKGGATLYRAVRAIDEKRDDEFRKLYQQSLDHFAAARQANPKDGGVDAIMGGSFAIFADRLPKEHRVPAWSKAYDSYRMLWNQQAPIVDRLPVHLRGELLGGLAQAAQRTGRTEEMGQYLDKILEVLRDTPYESVAKKWKANPQSAAGTTIACMTCHDSGRLSARISALGAK